MNKHTPGPWEIRERAFDETPFNKRRVYRVEIIAPQYYMGRRTHARDICQIIDYCDWTDHPANARLIAAAPETADQLSVAVGLLRAIIVDLPARRDWLDPVVESAAKKFLEDNKDL